MICYQSSRAMSNDLLNIFKFFVKKVRKRDYIWYLGVNAMRNECKSTDFFRFAREQYNNVRARAGMRTRERDAAGYVKICECVHMSPEGSREYRARRMRIFTYVPAR